MEIRTFLKITKEMWRYENKLSKDNCPVLTITDPKRKQIFVNLSAEDEVNIIMDFIPDYRWTMKVPKSRVDIILEYINRLPWKIDDSRNIHLWRYIVSRGFDV